MGTNMDVLVIGRQVLLRDEQAQLDAVARDQYLAQFKLD
jgi:hypothetical protein